MHMYLCTCTSTNPLSLQLKSNIQICIPMLRTNPQTIKSVQVGARDQPTLINLVGGDMEPFLGKRTCPGINTKFQLILPYTN